MSVKDVAMCLSAIPVEKYGEGNHDGWLELSLACHDASNGDAEEEWLDWCASDPLYGNDSRESNALRWESFSAGEPGGVTYRTLLKAVSDAGRKDIVARVMSEASDVADGFDTWDIEEELPGGSEEEDS